jgi:hypothetical protein
MASRQSESWERGNCGQAGRDRRDAGSIPAFLRISRTVEAAIFTPRPASSPWILRYPHTGSRGPVGGPGP